MAFAEILSGGDPRSLGRTSEVVETVLNGRTRLAELFECLFEDDEIVRMRASDALEKICREKPDWFKSYTGRLLTEVPAVRQPSVQWHLAQMLAEIKLNGAQKQQAISVMKDNLQAIDDWIVTNLTLESLATFVRRGDFGKQEFIGIAKKYQNSRHKSVASRANKLIKEFST